MFKSPNQQNLALLIEQIIEKVGRPVNVHVTQSVIESFGIREVDVYDDYGLLSIQDLAIYVHQQVILILDKKVNPTSGEKVENNSSDNFFTRFKTFLKYYSIGLFHLFPIFFQVISVIFFGYSIWTFSKFNELQSTAVVIGIINGFILSGGIVSVISKQVSFYWNHKDHFMVFQSVVFLIKKGIFILLFVNLGLFLFSFILDVFPIEMMILSVSYSFLIGSALLFMAPLYVIKRRWVISVAILIGSITALALKFYSCLNTYFTHWIGVLVVILVSYGYLMAYFKKRYISLKMYDKKEVHKAAIFYHNYIYFIYGTLFYFFVFADRMIAWSGARDRAFSYLIFFDKDYEIGMDLALLSYFLLAGVLEYSISSFTKNLDKGQKLTENNRIKFYNSVFIKDYWKNVMLLVLIAVFAAVVQFFLIYSPYGYKLQFKEDLLPINIEICVLGTLAYFFLSWSILNVLYFFTLGQPKLPLFAIIMACSTNLFIGLLCSRMFSYHYSVLGFLLGSLVFMFITTKGVLVFFKKIDYYYYAAY
jgi:hypothetical protein